MFISKAPAFLENATGAPLKKKAQPPLNLLLYFFFAL